MLVNLIPKLKSFFKGFWPIIVVLLLNIVIAALNYKPGTYLIGWDNLMPELNFGTNIGRSIFSVWQEYQSLGLLGGMGHATDLIRQVFLYLVSYVLPNSQLRYFWTFLTLFIGGAGVYILANKLLTRDDEKTFTNQLTALVAALFYTVNIATVQTYYVIFETFSAHFASLPWILLVVLNFTKKPNFKNFVLLFIVFAISTPAFYVPTLFIVTMAAVGMFLAVEFIFAKNRVSILKTAAIIVATTFIVNAYWLLPFSLYTVKNAATNIDAKINQMATTTIYEQNKEFGTILDTAQLKGFWFNNVDPDLSGNNTYMLGAWRVHFQNPAVEVAAVALFGLVLVGFISSFFKKEDKVSNIAFGVIFAFAFTMLAVDAIPFSIVDALIRKLPLFSQVFRFPFTKFSLLAGFTYSIMAAFGLKFIIQRLRNIKFINYALIALVTIVILFVSLPIFQGKFIYDKERLNIPNEYFQTFNYFAHQDQNARIADLPQPTFWGWTNYRWGSGGSGFIWYGIKQPILDRNFDVWSQNSENYYYELSSAINSKDPVALKQVFDKYQVSYVLLDENIIYPSSPKSLLYDTTESLLSQIPNVTLAKKFGNIKIYEVKNNVHSFIFTAPTNLPTVDVPFWKTNDVAYTKLGNYINVQSDQQSQYIFPFASLFSQKDVNTRSFNAVNNKNSISFSIKTKLNQPTTIFLPDYLSKEQFVPVGIYSIKQTNGQILVTGNLEKPEMEIDGHLSQNYAGTNLFAFTLPAGSYPITVNINGISNFQITGDETSQKIGVGFLISQQSNIITATTNDGSQSQIIDGTALSRFYQKSSVDLGKGTHTITIDVPKVDDSYLSYVADITSVKVDSCDSFRDGPSSSSLKSGVTLTTLNTTTCLSMLAPNLIHNLGYAVFAKDKNEAGRNLHFWISNEDEKTNPIDTYLAGNGTESFILQPQEQDGRGYSFHFDNISIGRDRTINSLSSFEVYPIPYDYLSSIYLDTGKNSANHEINAATRVSHPNESLYTINLKNKNATTLALSQSFDNGWHAYYVNNTSFITEAFPFIFGKAVKQHIELNSWENGWLIDHGNTGKIVIVYLPQYLEYFGFLLLIISTLSLTTKGLLKLRK